jgi:23S rRNA (uracil1939-C5)-methyltransferase
LTETPLVVDVERLTFGFDALAHRDRQVVFVPYAAPGDRVALGRVARKSGYLRGEVETVVAAGPDRVVPGCRWFPTCGGCQWQHVAPSAQRRAKAAIVAEQLARIAGVRDAEVLPTIASPADWGYRARISLVAEGRRAGYHRARSHALVEVGDCPIADPVVTGHLDVARAWLAALRVPLERVTIAAAPGGVVLAGGARVRPGPADARASDAVLAGTASVRGIVVTGGGERMVRGYPHVRVPLEKGLDLEVPVDAFAQVNPGANRLLLETVLSLARFGAGTRVLDLYCGAGNFALPLARRGALVHGVERSTLAVEAGRANASRLGIETATFAADEVERAVRAVAPGTVDLVVMDPPRAGAAPARDGLVALRVPRILYVSCDPATLARDIRVLLANGYRLGRVQPIDLFPQTYHVETAAELLLT